MATATATKRRKTTKKVSVKNTLTDLNCALINGSESLIDSTVITGEKYQKLFAKSVKKTEPIIEKQVDIMFDTIESLKDQFDFGTVRFKKLIGWNDKVITKYRKKAVKNIESFKKTAEEKIDAVQTELNELIPAIPAPVKEVKATIAKPAKKVAVRAKKVAAKVSKTTAKKATAKSTAKANDLQIIDGIGPKMEKVLISIGYKTISKIANASAATIENKIEATGTALRGANVKSWIAQAKKINK